MERREERVEKALKICEEILDHKAAPWNLKLNAAKTMLSVTAPKMKSVDVRVMNSQPMSYTSMVQVAKMVAEKMEADKKLIPSLPTPALPEALRANESEALRANESEALRVDTEVIMYDEETFTIDENTWEMDNVPSDVNF